MSGVDAGARLRALGAYGLKAAELGALEMDGRFPDVGSLAAATRATVLDVVGVGSVAADRITQALQLAGYALGSPLPIPDAATPPADLIARLAWTELQRDRALEVLGALIAKGGGSLTIPSADLPPVPVSQLYLRMLSNGDVVLTLMAA